ncbi:hypothetical protein BHE74_00009334 [Ensete ventricosum]|nr:hypothetical protein BHE74_00009334 [Ensete ventricosum]
MFRILFTSLLQPSQWVETFKAKVCSVTKNQLHFSESKQRKEAEESEKEEMREQRRRMKSLAVGESELEERAKEKKGRGVEQCGLWRRNEATPSGL